jgi:hypothetical protein
MSAPARQAFDRLYGHLLLSGQDAAWHVFKSGWEACQNHLRDATKKVDAVNTSPERVEKKAGNKHIAAPAQEPVAWKHDCAALLTNDVELWVDRCPHCGKPRTTPPSPAQPCKYGNEPASCTSSPMDCQCALDSVFEQPAQEPVAEVKLKQQGGNAGLATVIHEIFDPMREPLRVGDKLYTTPPAPAQPLPPNCGTGYCSCIECLKGGATKPTIKHLPADDTEGGAA